MKAKNYSCMPFRLLSRYTYILFISGSVFSCIDAIDFSPQPTDKKLVVDGFITNEAGPYTVKLSYTAPYTTNTGNAPVSGATLTITDDLGLTTTLAEREEGVYLTPANFRGNAGRTYQLHITSSENQQYTSTPVTLLPVAPIDSLYYVFTQKSRVTDNNVEVLDNYFDIYVEFQDDADQKNYYQWDWESIYEVRTQPEDFCNYFDCVAGIIPPDCCAECWVSDFNNQVVVLDDKLVNGNTIRQRVGTIAITEFAFYAKYYLHVKQYSLSQEAYAYWQYIRDQKENAGTIFSPAPGRVAGNITNPNDPEEVVLGYFWASGVATDSLFIYRNNVPASITLGNLLYPNDCRLIENSTTERPVFW